MNEAEELWAMIEKGAFRKEGAIPLSNRQKRLKEKSKRSEELARKLAKVEKDNKAALQSMQNWQAVAKIQILFQTSCTCGQVSYFPEVFLKPAPPLLRYQHKLNKTIWEKRADQGEAIPSNLPTEVRVLPMHSTHCPHCVTAFKEAK